MKQLPTIILLREESETPDPYRQALEQAGFDVHFLPPLRFHGVPAETLLDLMGSPETFGGLILTSPRAARQVMEALASRPRLRQAWQQLPVYTVGPRTADALARVGFQPVAGGGTAASLAEIIVRQPPERPLLFLSGNLRRETLPRLLEAAGIPFEEHTIYTTEPATDLRLPFVPDWLVFFSPSGVMAAYQSFPENPSLKAAIGPTTAEALREVGWPPAVVAETPTPESLSKALRAYYVR